MTTAYIILSLSLVLLGGFLLFKRREFARGTTSGMTRMLMAHSPAAEMRYDAFVARLRVSLLKWRDITYAFVTRLWRTTRVFLRHIVVLLAAKMVQAVRGEKLMYGNGAPSLYLKRLGAEMQNGDDLKPEDVREEFVHRIEVTTPVNEEKTE